MAPNRLKRDFTTERPDQKWLADITYIHTLEGWLYLAAILDMYSRRIIGWAMAERMTSALTIQASMNGVGTWYDNAPMESFFGTLKSERVHHCDYQTREEARTDLFFYIEARYNRRRLHSALGYLSPEAFEKAHCQQSEHALTLCPQK